MQITESKLWQSRHLICIWLFFVLHFNSHLPKTPHMSFTSPLPLAPWPTACLYAQKSTQVDCIIDFSILEVNVFLYTSAKNDPKFFTRFEQLQRHGCI
jgi:hypothetical protein